MCTVRSHLRSVLLKKKTLCSLGNLVALTTKQKRSHSKVVRFMFYSLVKNEEVARVVILVRQI